MAKVESEVQALESEVVCPAAEHLRNGCQLVPMSDCVLQLQNSFAEEQTGLDGSYLLLHLIVAHTQRFIRGNMVPWTLRPRKLKQQLRWQPVIRKQSSKRTRNGAKRGTLLNHPIETPQAPPQQPTPQGSVRCSNGLGRNSFLENHPKSKRGRSQKNTFVATNVHLQEAASTTMLNDFVDVVPENLSSNEETTHEGPHYPSSSPLQDPTNSEPEKHISSSFCYLSPM